MAQVLSHNFDPGLRPHGLSWPGRLIGQVSRSVSLSPPWLVSATIFLLALTIRLVRLQQPLCENFIDRQVHTAMMARNLARGGSALYPEIDVAPFPAYYMLEFPGYPLLAASVKFASGMDLDSAGRLVSSFALAMACLLLFDLVRRHDGLAVGFWAGTALAFMPVTIRYGRAFQPDATMIALVVGAVWSMDRWCERGGRYLLALAAVATSGALLLKVIAAYMLLPLAYLAWKRCGRSILGRWDLRLAFAVMILPALAWYVHAWHVAASGATVSTPFWHAHKWISPTRLFHASTYQQLAYYVGLRVLTPIGVALALVGVMLRVRPASTAIRGFSLHRKSQAGASANRPISERARLRLAAERAAVLALVEDDDQSPAASRSPKKSGSHEGSPGLGSMLFHVWLGALATYLPILIRKLDHEHYYLALAPVAAVFIARGLVAIASAPLAVRCYVSGKLAAACLVAGLFACDLLASFSTFQTPDEWRNVTAAAAVAREYTPRDALVAGHSAVLFYADRRGFTFAYAPHEVDYLFGTWCERCSEPTPAALLEFYRDRGAEYFVELLGTGRERNNRPFFEYLRSHYRVMHEEPGSCIVVALKS